MIFELNCSEIYVNKAAKTFERTIPFKVYRLVNDRIKTNVHTHDYVQIWYVMSGCCIHSVNDTSNMLEKGSLFVLPPFVSHKIEIAGEEDVQVIGCEFAASFINENISQPRLDSSLFDFAYLEPFLVSHEAVKPRLHLKGKSQIKAEELLLDMLQEYEQEGKYYEINIKADLLKLLAIAAREYENANDSNRDELFEKYRDSVKSAIKYIDDNFTGQLYIEEVCKIAMMSQTYFSNIFKQITNKTFVEYINSLRIALAAELLEGSGRPVTEISFEAGFNDAAYFNKVFKKETGLSPRQYRRSHCMAGQK